PQRSLPMSFDISRRAVLTCLLVLGGLAGNAEASKPQVPADILKGDIIISDSRIPTRWTSQTEYGSELKRSRKNSLVYDAKTGKLLIYYAAFFTEPINDATTTLVIEDVSNGIATPNEKGKWDVPLEKKGDRALYSSIELDRVNFGSDKKYRFVIKGR